MRRFCSCQTLCYSNKNKFRIILNNTNFCNLLQLWSANCFTQTRLPSPVYLKNLDPHPPNSSTFNETTREIPFNFPPFWPIFQPWLLCSKKIKIYPFLLTKKFSCIFLRILMWNNFFKCECVFNNKKLRWLKKSKKYCKN